ncbi:phosphatase PAP2 family protein [Solitalea sp. MAHUQ-68]|uniref:Phosphatase PAP2 family protein n=1 Tax=Solitalea agri TaxID=2953739 RepID=A0A9X2JCB1_9SPHI|nr:phosphatase PAP2 family protein [Solitalea agri]MCO4293332.1 phosphatase PAP2 family protein [Solitalea agri]
MKKDQMWKIRLTIALLFVSRSFSVYAQLADTMIMKQEPIIKYGQSSKLNSPIEKVAFIGVPIAMVTYGFCALNNEELKEINGSTRVEIKEDHPHFATTADNYLQFAPAVAVYGLNAMNVPGKNNFRDRSMIYLLSTVFMSTTVHGLKNVTHEQRPDGSDYLSFPSGHTATAFAAAEFLRQEYKDQSMWYGIAGYGVATATGVLRMYNNKHWFSDVVAGAGIGILSTEMAYWVYPPIKRVLFKDKSPKALVAPTYYDKTIGLSLVVKL